MSPLITLKEYLHMRNITALTLGLLGFLIISGSANDCDGACMDQANTLGEMLLLVTIGLTLLGAATLIYKGENQDG